MHAPRALDMFCCAGGASMGLAQAGFDVTGMDIEPRADYPFHMIEADALKEDPQWLRREFDFIWASPPCQFATAYKRRKGVAEDAVNLIPQTRELLRKTGLPFVIENVVGARDHLRSPVQLCGSSFGLDVRRHRLFEAHGFTIDPVPCAHEWQTPRFPPATNRTNLRRTVEVGVWRIPLETQQEAMGISWMSLKELSQAIPPAYAKHIGQCAMRLFDYEE